MSKAETLPGMAFDAADAAAEVGEALILDLDGFEGPLHLLLALARTQKVDLVQISIAELADQYLAFIGAASERRFSLAADYLVMAAWLTYLKSRLLLPKPERHADDEPPAEMLAETLAFRLAKLQAMREAAEALKSLPRTGVDIFTRGDPDALTLTVAAATRPEGDLYALMAAYAAQRQRPDAVSYQAQARTEAYPLQEARARLRELLPRLAGWTSLERVTPALYGPTRASCVASTFAAGLEMVKEGALEVQQLEAFADLYLRARELQAGEHAEEGGAVRRTAA